jgi:nitric oxide dioxygenase
VTREGTESIACPSCIRCSGRGFAAAAGLSQETIDICKSTAPVLAEHGYSITKTMYSKMLADHPDVSELFNKTHQQEINGQKAFQPQALASAVHAYASHMDDLGALTTAVERIAHKHVSVMVGASDIQQTM